MDVCAGINTPGERDGHLSANGRSISKHKTVVAAPKVVGARNRRSVTNVCAVTDGFVPMLGP